jgi:hypothetical protein
MPTATPASTFATGRIIEAGCWAHVRRKFFDVHAATPSPVAKEALDRIGQFYAVEQTINGSLPDQRQQQRQLRSRPVAEALAAWAEENPPQALAQIRAGGGLPLYAGAMDGTHPLLRRRPPEPRQPPGRARFAWRRHRPQELSVCRVRSRWPRAAAIYSLIETAKLNGLDPQAWLTDTLDKLVNLWPAARIDELLP